MRALLLALAVVAGCGFDSSGFADRGGGDGDDAPIDSGVVPAIDSGAGPVDAGSEPFDAVALPACETPWVEEATGCHLYVKDSSLAFDAAETDCEAQGGHLVVEDTGNEFAEVAAGMGPFEPAGRFWIGLHDPAPDDNLFVWVNGDALAETHWADTEPSNTGDCVNARPDGTWGDRNCAETKIYACEKND